MNEPTCHEESVGPYEPRDDDELTQACERYRKHVAACDGKQSAALFAGSPYSRTKHGEHWEWDDTQLRLDQAKLADAYLADHAHQQLSVEELTERFYAMKAERDTLQQRIQGCLESANGRWDEWGERAVDAYKWLVGERGIGSA